MACWNVKFIITITRKPGETGSRLPGVGSGDSNASRILWDTLRLLRIRNWVYGDAITKRDIGSSSITIVEITLIRSWSPFLRLVRSLAGALIISIIVHAIGEPLLFHRVFIRCLDFYSSSESCVSGHRGIPLSIAIWQWIDSNGTPVHVSEASSKPSLDSEFWSLYSEYSDSYVEFESLKSSFIGYWSL